MKYGFASDVHGSVFDLFSLADEIKRERCDKFFMLGDLCGLGDDRMIREGLTRFGCPVIYVEGNSDTPGFMSRCGLSGAHTSYVEQVDGRALFCTHGHIYNRYRLPDLLKKGDIFFYGHTHVAALSEQDGIILVNVGSASRPRGSDQKTYATYDGREIVIKTLENETLFRKKL